MDEQVIKVDYEIPPGLNQPYIETSIEHGLTHRSDNLEVGKLLVNKLQGYFGFTIADYGVGRKSAGLFKACNSIEHQSKGMTRTQDRVDIFNR